MNKSLPFTYFVASCIFGYIAGAYIRFGGMASDGLIDGLLFLPITQLMTIVYSFGFVFGVFEVANFIHGVGHILFWYSLYLCFEKSSNIGLYLISISGIALSFNGLKYFWMMMSV